MMTSKLLPTPTGTDYKSRGPNSKQVGIDNFFKKLSLDQPPSSSQQELPVSPPVVPGSVEAQAMTVGSGEKLLELLPKSSQSGASLKMLEDCLVLKGGWFSRICYLSWKPLVTKQGRLLYQLAPKTPRTEGTGCGLLVTPQAMDGSGKGRALRLKKDCNRNPNTPGSWRGDLKDHIAMLPTPSTKDVSGGAVKAIPTATGFKRVSKQGVSHGAQLHDVMKTLSAVSGKTKADRGTNPGLKLHSDFVSWMQGYPLDWMDV